MNGFEACDHAEEGAAATARRAGEDDELAVIDFEIEFLTAGESGDMLDGDFGHYWNEAKRLVGCDNS